MAQPVAATLVNGPETQNRLAHRQAQLTAHLTIAQQLPIQLPAHRSVVSN